jgi:hypothetical protein
MTERLPDYLFHLPWEVEVNTPPCHHLYLHSINKMPLLHLPQILSSDHRWKIIN